jgi:hypothetical protein
MDDRGFGFKFDVFGVDDDASAALDVDGGGVDGGGVVAGVVDVDGGLLLSFGVDGGFLLGFGVGGVCTGFEVGLLSGLGGLGTAPK